MNLKTLDPGVKAAFQNAGCTLTAEQEHVAAAAGIDWASVFQTLGQIAVKILPIILATIAGNQPAPKQAAAGCCDHKACAFDTLAAILHAGEVASRHCCQCCCES